MSTSGNSLMKPFIAPVFTSCFVLSTLFLSGCTTPTTSRQGLGFTEITDRPAEKFLLAGIRAYDDGQYQTAEQLFVQSLSNGLASARDRSVARKHLAFIYCTSERLVACETAFRSARIDDSTFVLSKSEASHPQWGPIYLRSRQ
jgi:Tfp pilus assembly protein PilF